MRRFYGLLYAYWCIRIQLVVELVNAVLLQRPVTAVLVSVLSVPLGGGGLSGLWCWFCPAELVPFPLHAQSSETLG